MQKIRGENSWCPRRDEAYLGVLVDDLITLGTQEPYRMFTSRAEHRLLLREDNADLRLTEKGRKLGLIDDQRWQAFCKKREAIEQEQQRLRDIIIRPGDLPKTMEQEVLGDKLRRETRATELLTRPFVTYQTLMSLPGVGPGVADKKVAEQVEIQEKYAGYIKRQRQEVEKTRQAEAVKLPEALDYEQVKGLSSEVREKLMRHRPATLGQAGRIAGVTPAATSLLLIHLKKHRA